MKKENIIIWLLGSATLVVLGLQVMLSNEATTKTESTLFGVLQFLLSLGFAWVLAKQSSQQEFESKQRKFAVAAFRRIKEIEAQTDHLIRRLGNAIDGPEDKYCHELDIAKTLAISISDTTRSSKLDWADIIGDQIEVIEKIQNIQGESKTNTIDELQNQANELDIAELKKSLETELRLSLSDNKRPTQKILSEEMDSNGKIILKGFVESKWGYAREISSLKLGEKLKVKIADERKRIAALAAYDESGNFVGSFLNKYGNSYDEFTRGACVAIGSSEFEGTVISIDKLPPKDENSAHYRTLFNIEVVSHDIVEGEWTEA
ncbi:TPA: hypothetical protein NKW28_004443 [Vibrio parahaemolyticus]|nr:hypothetical protein [Vibrio parahaemolyticus]